MDTNVLVPKSGGDTAYGGGSGPNWKLDQLASLFAPGPNELLIGRHVVALRLRCSITVANAGMASVDIAPERLVNFVKTVTLTSQNQVLPIQLASDNAGLALYYMAWRLSGKKPSPGTLTVGAGSSATTVFDLELPIVRLPLGSRQVDPGADPEVWQGSTLSATFGDGTSGKMFASGVTVSSGSLALYADAGYDSRLMCCGLPLELGMSGLPGSSTSVASFADTRALAALLLKAQADGTNTATAFSLTEIATVSLLLGNLQVWSQTGTADELNRQFNARAVASVYDSLPNLADSAGSPVIQLTGPLDRGQSNITERPYCPVDPVLSMSGTIDSTYATARFAYLRQRNSQTYAKTVAAALRWQGDLIPIGAGDAAQAPAEILPWLPFYVRRQKKAS